MKNFIQNGKSIDVTGPLGGLLSGQPFVFGSLPVVAATDIAEGTTGAAATTGVFDLAVTGANDAGNAAIGFGDEVYMDGTEINADSANGTRYGIALGVVAGGETSQIPVMIGR